MPAPFLFLPIMLRRCSIGERNKGLWFDCSALCFSPFLVGVGVFGNITQKRFAACVGRAVKITAQISCVLERNFDLILRSAAFPDCHGAANQRGEVEKCQLCVQLLKRTIVRTPVQEFQPRLVLQRVRALLDTLAQTVNLLHFLDRKFITREICQQCFVVAAAADFKPHNTAVNHVRRGEVKARYPRFFR